MDGKYFSGELYVDVKAEQYKALGFKKYNICSLILSLFEAAVARVNRMAKANNISGNLKGNGYQSGGTLIVKKGGTDVILSYKMKGIADHLENEEILRALGIDASEAVAVSGAVVAEPSKAQAQVRECDDTMCQIGIATKAEEKKDK